MLVLGVPKRDHHIVLRLHGKIVACICFIKDEQGRVYRVGFVCPPEVRITRERVKE